MQLPESVQDGGFGRAADLPPLASAILGVAHSYLAAPQPWTVPVAFRITAGTAVFERNSVFSAPAPGSHRNSLAKVGTIGGDNGRAYRGITRLVEA